MISTSTLFLPEKKLKRKQGNLNPDPFHLTIEEARVLAQHTGNETILKAIDEAVWAGEQTVAIDKEYEQIWAEIKN